MIRTETASGLLRAIRSLDRELVATRYKRLGPKLERKCALVIRYIQALRREAKRS
jgi:hypothetical protein